MVVILLGVAGGELEVVDVEEKSHLAVTTAGFRVFLFGRLPRVELNFNFKFQSSQHTASNVFLLGLAFASISGQWERIPLLSESVTVICSPPSNNLNAKTLPLIMPETRLYIEMVRINKKLTVQRCGFPLILRVLGMVSIGCMLLHTVLVLS